VDKEKRLAEALRQEQPKPKVCLEHVRPVYFDGEECDACRAIREWLAMTETSQWTWLAGAKRSTT
jgi:hypothetical protein